LLERTDSTEKEREAMDCGGGRGWQRGKKTTQTLLGILRENHDFVEGRERVSAGSSGKD